jgi:hypothetical protein
VWGLCRENGHITGSYVDHLVFVAQLHLSGQDVDHLFSGVPEPLVRVASPRLERKEPRL